MTLHEHDFGLPEGQVVRMCAIDGCVEMRIGTKDGQFRELTANERTAVGMICKCTWCWLISIGATIVMPDGRVFGGEK